MPTWKEVSELYLSYQQQRSKLRRAVNSSSRFINQLRTLKAGHELSDEINNTDIVKLLQASFSVKPETLSATIAMQLQAKLIVGPQAGLLLQLFTYLHQQSAFSETNYEAVITHDARFTFAKLIINNKVQLTQAYHSQPLRWLSQGKLSVDLTLAHLFLRLEQCDAALHWFQIAIETEEQLDLRYFPEARLIDKFCLALASLCRAHDTDASLSNMLKLYQHAATAGSIQAMLVLGEHYQVESQENRQANQKSFQYYLQAANSGCERARTPLERMAGQGSSQQQLKLSKHYRIFKNPERAAYWQSCAEEVSKTSYEITMQH